MKRYLFLFFLVPLWLHAAATLSLRDNLQKANPGDFVVTAQNKNYTLFHIVDKGPDFLTIEEITVPSTQKSPKSWKEWVIQGAPGHTNWFLYAVRLTSGDIERSYSLSRKNWVKISATESFLPTLLNLSFTAVPQEERRKVGPPPSGTSPDFRKLWQPKMIRDGQVIPGVAFEGWKTHWPKDQTDLSGKLIEVYLPTDTSYPSYFPYWLQVRGGIAKATLYMIDSGSNLHHKLSSFPIDKK